MPELKVPVFTHIVHYVCDFCGQGEMIPTGIVMTSCPPQYEHQCTHCKVVSTYVGKCYPETVYEEGNDLQMKYANNAASKGKSDDPH